MDVIEPPKIGCIVATYNRPRSLIRLLDNITDQARIDLKNKVVVSVVDDGSDIDLIGLFPPYPFEFHYLYRGRSLNDSPRVGTCRNMAYEALEGCDLILQLDDDLTFHRYLLSEMQNLAVLYSEEHWAWIPRLSNNRDVKRVDDYSRGRDGRWFDGKVQWMSANYTSGMAAGLLMPERTWQLVGGYDTDYDGYVGVEDHDLLYRIQQAGGKLSLAPYFVSVEDEETDSWRDPMNERAVALGRERNEAIFQSKHPEAGYGCS